jgi:uncharacterized membrane protein (UPF0127 family)
MMVCRVEHNRRRLRMQVHVCESRFDRGRGLLLRPRPDIHTAFLLRNCKAVHTIGLSYPLDILFCDASGRILRIVHGLGPGRMVRERRANHVWELCAGAASHWGWRIGDAVEPCSG